MEVSKYHGPFREVPIMKATDIAPYLGTLLYGNKHFETLPSQHCKQFAESEGLPWYGTWSSTRENLATELSIMGVLGG